MNKKSLSKKLKQKKFTIAVAESCTGGLISKLLTDISGSSKYFILGIAAYSFEAKKKLLRIPASILKSKGAVSKEVAKLMAKNVRNIAKSDIGLGITGIAGPTGGTKSKPLGLVYIAVASNNKTITKKFILKGTRSQVRQKSAAKALGLINRII